ncbi:hypothetical protein V8E36_008347 [Tilletia maclaganii]
MSFKYSSDSARRRSASVLPAMAMAMTTRTRTMVSRPLLLAVLLLLTTPATVRAHPHHHDGPADESVPIDSLLWIHTSLQAFTWIILFPLAMVMGLVRHRLHVPLAITSLLLTTGGYVLGHKHGGRAFPHSAHGTSASLLIWYLAAQTGLGLYLKLHLRWKAEPFVRPPLLFVHGLLGRCFPLVGWVQCLLGIFTLRSWCMAGPHRAQCLSYHGLGSAVQAYAVVMLIMTKAAAGWLQRKGHSQEWFDSWLLFGWGSANVLAQVPSGPFSKANVQSTMLGLLWIFGGALGLWLSRGGQRSVIPGLVIILTGWVMIGSSQQLAIANNIYSLLGFVLMAAGIARIIEVCFVLKEEPSGASTSAARPSRQPPPSNRHAEDAQEEEEEEGLEREVESLSHALGDNLSSPAKAWSEVKAFQYLPPFFLTAAGVIFMSATDEELQWADKVGGGEQGSITWGLVDFTIALALFLWFNILIDLYVRWGGYRGLAGGSTGSHESHSGLLERGGLATTGRRRRAQQQQQQGEYVPLTTRARLPAPGSRSSADPGTGTGTNGAEKPGPRGILANGARRQAGPPRGVDHEEGEEDEKVVQAGIVGATRQGGGGGGPPYEHEQRHHVLFADSEEDDDHDPFDDERD